MFGFLKKKPAVAVQKKEEPTQPYGTKVSSITKAGIDFYWKKVDIASGYELYRANNADAEYELIFTAKRRNIGDFVDAGFDHNEKTIYYKVRSFLDTEENGRVYSELTEPVAANYIEEMRIERDRFFMYDGTERKIIAVQGWGEPDDLEWSSSEPEVASIDAEGLIKAKSSGTTVIRCYSKSLDMGASATLTVNRQPSRKLREYDDRFKLDEDGIWRNKSANNTDRAVIMMAGDIMCGSRQMTDQAVGEDDWDFSDSFEYIRRITAESDFSIVNLETLLASSWPYMIDESFINNMNNCNAPARILDGIKYGGFDALSLANNHNCDSIPRALMDTVEQVDLYKYARTGVRKTGEKGYFIADINGIGVGFLSYNCPDAGFNGKDKMFWKPEELEEHVNVFDKERAAKDVELCRADGAEYIIVYMHWGSKNFYNVTDAQRRYAQEVADAGVDYITGSNPHLVQAFDTIEASDGRLVPCAYSIGNFIATMNQVKGNRESVIMRAVLCRDEDGKVVLEETNYIPCRVYREVEGKQWAAIPLSGHFDKKYDAKYKKSSNERIVTAMGNGIKRY